MDLKYRLIEVTPENIIDHPQAVCFIKRENARYNKKVEWYSEHYKEGVRIKLLYTGDMAKSIGFIEYVPGKFCWRPVEAEGYMFIHCIWTYRKQNQNQGLGGVLIKEVEKEASGMNGVAVVTSDKSFMCKKEIFLKNGYKIIYESGSEQILVKQFRKGALPSFKVDANEAARYNDLTMIYSGQCPWVARFIEEVKPVLKKEKLDPDIIELKTASRAQKAPSAYGVFNLVYKGKVLADRYISTTRFSNILRKDVKEK